MNRRRLAILAAIAVLILLFGGRWVALRYTEYAWYVELGQGGRFGALLARSLLWQAIAALCFSAWYAAHTWAVYRSIGSVHLPRRLGNLDIAEQVRPRTLRLLSVAIAVVLGVASAWPFSDLAEYVAMYRATVPLSLPEPVLLKDASFYLGQLPLIELLHLAFMAAVMISTLLVFGLYLVTGSVTLGGRRLRLTPHARSHFVVILAFLALALAWGFQIDTWQLVGGGGRFGGALAPVDRAIRLPASNALALIALVVATASAMSLRWMRPTALFVTWATLGVAALLGRVVVPLLADAWRAADTQVLTRSLRQYADDWTIEGLGLRHLTVRDGNAMPEVSPESTAALARALAGVSPWSGEFAFLEAAFESAETADSAGRRAWSLTLAKAVDAAGRDRLVAIAVPQLDAFAAATRERRPRWAASHRGAGAWAGEPVAADAGMRSGELRFFSRLAPADTAPQHTTLALQAGPMRFVPRPADLGVEPQSEADSGDSRPGASLDRGWRRLLLAWALQSPPLMGEQTRPTDRVLYWRDVPGRLRRLYPFASFDSPRAVIADGRLLWAADGYITSARFPLAQRFRLQGEQVNYMTASYLATVDAAGGETRLFLRGTTPQASFATALATAWRAPLLPADSLQPAIRDRLGYPATLFAAQASMLARVGYGASRWMLEARDTTSASGQGATVRPTVAVLDLDATGPRLWLLAPLSDAAGRGLGAILAGTVDGEGMRLLLLMYDGVSLPTPTAAAARLVARGEPARAGAGTESVFRRGPALVVPAAGTVAYVQSLFATPDRNRRPLLVEAVAVLVGGQVAFGADAEGLANALRAGQDGSGSPATEPLGEAAMTEARAAFLALDSARLSGDWERFGRAWEALRRVLQADRVRP